MKKHNRAKVKAATRELLIAAGLESAEKLPLKSSQLGGDSPQTASHFNVTDFKRMSKFTPSPVLRIAEIAQGGPCETPEKEKYLN